MMNLGTTVDPIVLTKENIVQHITDLAKVLDAAAGPELKWMIIPKTLADVIKHRHMLDRRAKARKRKGRLKHL